MTKINDKLLFKTVTESYVCKLVAAIKPKSSSGIDDISNRLLKDIIAVIKVPLTIVINKSLMEGVFPDLMKIAKIIPLHKGGEQNLPDNYRLIFLYRFCLKFWRGWCTIRQLNTWKKQCNLSKALWI